MKDTELRILQLKALICPQQSRWPAPNIEISIAGDRPTIRGVQWEKLHAVADEARDRVAKAWAAMDEIDADKDLSREGKERKKKKVAAEAIVDFQKSKTLADAQDWVERQVAKWAEETGLTVKPPSNIAETVLQSEIRAHLAAMKGNKISFLEKHATDPRVASAILGAPPFLSGLTDAEVALVKTRIEQHVAPEVAKARDATLKAMTEAEQGWRMAINKIGELAGLTKGADGTWRDPSMSEAA